MGRWLRPLCHGAVLAIAACTGADITVIGPANPGTGGGPAQPAYTVLVTPTTTTIAAGAAVQLTAVVLDSTGTTLPGVTVSWQSGNAAVATVSGTGLVTGVAPGNAAIGASYGGGAATSTVTVTAVPVATIDIVPSADTLQRGTTLALTAVPRDAGGNPLTGRLVLWQSSNSGVAPVSGSGVVTAAAVGQATISATAEGKTGTAAITVVNVPVATVTVTPSTDTVFIGRTRTLTATTRDAGSNVLTGRVITWSSANTAVATVNATGVVTGVGSGTTTITATSEGQSGSATVVSMQVPVASVQVTPAIGSVVLGNTVTFTATPRDAGGIALAGRIITWSTANSGIATVSGSGATGVVTGVVLGSTTVTATSEGVPGQATVNVLAAPPTLVRVLLTPDTIIIAMSGSRQFTAQGRYSDSTTQAITVAFTATGGTVTAGGLYTAGTTPGAFRVVATAAGGLADTSLVTISPPPPVATVTVSPAIDTAFIGATASFTATTRDAANNILTGRVVTWSSSNTGVATVNGTGVVTGVAAGSATITATSEGQTGTATAVVTPVPVATVAVSPASGNVMIGATLSLTATTRDASGNVLTGRVVTWSSGNTAIATVNGSGVVTGVAAGPVTITATSEGKTGQSSVTVTAAAATLVRIILSPAADTLLSGNTRQFSAQGKMSDSSLQVVPVTYTAQGGTITANGLYTAGAITGAFNVIATAQALPKADTSRVTIAAAPPPGSYTALVGDDWSSYTSDAIFLATFGWGSTGSSTVFTVPDNVHLVPDPIFGQVVETRQPKDTSTGVCCGWTPQKYVGFPRLLDRAWYHVWVRFSPGFTTVGPVPAGAANAYKLLFMLWQGYNYRADVVFSNTDEYIIGYAFQGVTCTETPLPTSVDWGRVTTEWTNGDWWEYIIYYEKTGQFSARARFWRRQYSQGGVVNPGPWTMQGADKTNCSAATPQARAINMGANKNKTTPADQYIYWGPFEVVDGVQFPNPYGVGP